MANTFYTITKDDKFPDDSAKDISLTSFCASNDFNPRRSIQITIGKEYIYLTRKQVIELTNKLYYWLLD